MSSSTSFYSRVNHKDGHSLRFKAMEGDPKDITYGDLSAQTPDRVKPPHNGEVPPDQKSPAPKPETPAPPAIKTPSQISVTQRLDFAPTFLSNASRARHVTVRILGTDRLNLNSFHIRGKDSEDFFIRDLSSPSDSVEAVRIIFRPSQKGPRSAVLEFTSGPADKLFSVSLEEAQASNPASNFHRRKLISGMSSWEKRDV
jgi:hypothetical protein